jgi:hypothetical protein
MNKTLAALFTLFWLAGLAMAQVPTAGNVFFGYSYENSKLDVDRANLNGWEGSLEGKVFPHVGIVADFSGHYGSQDFATCSPIAGGGCGTTSASTHELNVMFGPRVSFSFGKWRPFGQAMFGIAHISTGFAQPLGNSFGSNNSLATALGGGLDYRIIRPLAWRFQFDYMHTNLFSTGQNNFRFSTGPVLRF